MSLIKTKNEIEKLREGGRHLAFVLKRLADTVKPGINTAELDELARKLIKEMGDKPSFLNYQPGGAGFPFPAALCTSVNDEVVHGIPGDRVLKEGDIIGLDLGLEHDKLFVDMAITVPVGRIDSAAEKLIDTTRKALNVGLKEVKAGARIGDIGHAIEKLVRPLGYGIVRELGGHGVGHDVHEKPYIPNFGERGTGEKLVTGMVIAIEPMINEGVAGIKDSADRFGYVTKDGKRSAHFEHTVVVTEKGAEILTLDK
jgi:methionyl aminopeptidase